MHRLLELDQMLCRVRVCNVGIQPEWGCVSVFYQQVKRSGLLDCVLCIRQQGQGASEQDFARALAAAEPAVAQLIAAQDRLVAEAQVRPANLPCCQLSANPESETPQRFILIPAVRHCSGSEAGPSRAGRPRPSSHAHGGTARPAFDCQRPAVCCVLWSADMLAVLDPHPHVSVVIVTVVR